MEPFELIENISIASATDSDVPSESITNDWSEVEEISDVQSVSSVHSGSEVRPGLIPAEIETDTGQTRDTQALLAEIARLNGRIDELEADNGQLHLELSQTRVALYQRERELNAALDINRKQTIKIFKRVDRAKKHLKTHRLSKRKNKTKGKRTEKNLRKKLFNKTHASAKHHNQVRARNR